MVKHQQFENQQDFHREISLRPGRLAMLPVP